MTKQNPNKTVVTSLLIAFIAANVEFTLAAQWAPRPAQNQSCLNLVSTSQSESESAPDAASILAAARIIYICSRTGFVKSEVIENELLKRAEFHQAGLVITKDLRAADLVMEVRRSNFTTEYPYVVVNPRTRLVVASGKVNSLFGTAAGKIAKGFIKQVQKARTPSGGKSK